MDKIITVIFSFLIIASITFAAVKPDQIGLPQERGKGLSNATTHTPTFVAEKLKYMLTLFSTGVKGIGHSLSTWIQSSFKPATKK